MRRFERAVQAGLSLVEATPKLKTVAGVPLHVRVGIATGLVVVGDLIGTGAAQEQAVVGEDAEILAARLQALAEPNTVVIAEGTRRLLGNLFELHDLGAKDVKGVAGPVRAWAVLRASSVESRFEALHTTGLAALVGREEEFESLLLRWTRAKTGQGQSGDMLSGRRPASKQIHGSRGGAAGSASPASRIPAFALFLLPAAYRQRASPDHRSDGTRPLDWRYDDRTTSEARQAGRYRSAPFLDLAQDARALGRDAVASETTDAIRRST